MYWRLKAIKVEAWFGPALAQGFPGIEYSYHL